MGNKPIIGVTPWYRYEEKMTYIKNGYMEGLIEAGGMPVLLPLTVDDHLLSEYADRCHGFLLPGGPDADARSYGEQNLPFNGEISPWRDHMETFITRKAIEWGKPILGICRGIQVMNAAMGGTLYQDIRSQINDRSTLKHSQEAPKWYPTHDVYIERGTKLWKLFEKECLSVNSFHHQGVKDVAPGFIISSRSPDGLIESIEAEGHKFALGVQWHPELMWQEDELFLKLFTGLVEYARGTE